jgi:hypothetical protein
MSELKPYRDERRVEAMTKSLRAAFDQGTSSEVLAQLTKAAMDAEAPRTAEPIEPAKPSDVVKRFRQWSEADERFRAPSPGSAEVGEHSQEFERRWQAYERTVNEADTSRH